MKNTEKEYKEIIEAENKILKNALNHIINPIKFMQDNLKEGEILNGIYAIQLSNDANYLKEIASKSLNSLLPNPPQK